MFRCKLLLKYFATCKKIQSKSKLTPSVFVPDSASLSCFTLKRSLNDSRNDSNGFKKLHSAPKVPITLSYEKSFSNFSEAKCWNCDQYLEGGNFTCASCGALLYPKKKLNYFELFGFSQTFDIDVEALSQKYKKLQTIFHPDKFAGKTKVEQELSETYSRLVNKAYSALKDPLQRGFYLLTLLKYPECDSPLDQEFLKSMMKKNEDLESLTNAHSIEKYRNDLERDMKGYFNLTNQAFKSGNLNEAKINLTRITYLKSMDKRAKNKIENLQEKKTC